MVCTWLRRLLDGSWSMTADDPLASPAAEIMPTRLTADDLAAFAMNNFTDIAANPARLALARPTLFQRHPEGIKLTSGKTSSFKIECDALTEEDWDGLAHLASTMLPPYLDVVGVPRGGIPFASALRRYATDSDALLIADDVWTTGRSMKRYRAEYLKMSTSWSKVFGVVAFARGACEGWVQPVFTMSVPNRYPAPERLHPPTA
jgi:hypothetical protein